MAETLDLTDWVAGETHTIQDTVVDETAAAVSLVGAAISYKLREGDAGGTVKVTNTIGAGIVVSGTGNNIFTITLDPADTSGLQGAYYHEAQVTLADLTVFTAFAGRVIISESGA